MTEIDRCRTPGCRTTPESGYAPRGLCGWCETRGLEAIDAQCYDWSDLQALIFDKARGGLDIVRVPFGPSGPINEVADTIARKIAYLAVLWEIAVCELARLSDPPNQQAMATYSDLARASRALAAHYTALLAVRDHDHIDYDRKPATADGVDAVIDMTATHRQARWLIGVTAKTTSEPGACPACGRETLRHRDGADTVWCVTCENVMSWDDYQDSVALVPVGRAA